jgi:sensor histidine kinase YesM
MQASQINRAVDFMREAFAEVSKLWWAFFDWVAVVDWRKLAITWLLALFFLGMLNTPEPAVWYIFLSFGIKVLAGGKRRAELVAKDATLKAEVATLERRLTEAQMAALQAQVEPHFLFNTLASVRSLVSSDPLRAAQTIDALAQHLRATLPRLRAETGVAQSTLGEQFAICASYLELMQVRLGERLRVDIRLPPELRDVPFPPLLLLSLVENSIKHGVEPKPGFTHVVLAARAIEDGGRKQLEVQVEDDGAGLKLGMGEGTGLANVRAQLRTRFAMAASFELSERSSGGVLARLVLPLEPLEA